MNVRRKRSLPCRFPFAWFDRRHDVGRWSLRLFYGDAVPPPPTPLSACHDDISAVLDGAR